MCFGKKPAKTYYYHSEVVPTREAHHHHHHKHHAPRASYTSSHHRHSSHSPRVSTTSHHRAVPVVHRALSVRSKKGGDGGNTSQTSPTHRKGFTFASLRGSIQPELSRKLYRVIKCSNNLVSAHENAGRERTNIATQLSEWGEQTGDDGVSDISDKVGVILSELGDVEDNYAHGLEDARGVLKTIRNTEKSVQPSRDSKAKIADEIQKIKVKEPQSTRLVVLEQELIRAEAENLVAEAQLTNVTRQKLKEAYAAEFAAVIERAEKQIILAQHGRRLLALLDDSPVTPGDARESYQEGVLRDRFSTTPRTTSARRAYASAASQPDIYDVVCVGGGPAGLSLLTALRSNAATASLRVALVEAQDLAKTRDWKLPPDRFSNRCSSLTPSSANFLNRIGAWDHLARERVQPYHEMQVWDGVTDARIEAFAPDERYRGAEVFDKVKVENITFGEDKDDLDLTQWPVVHLSGGKQLAARLLVGADGANSPVRAFAEIESRGWDYERHGVVATLEMEDEGWGGHDMKIAYQRFLPTGPVAMLPMPGRYATMVWSTTPRNAALLKSLPAKDFLAVVNAAFRLRPVDLEFMHTTESGQAEELLWRLQHTHVNHQSVPQTVVSVQEGSVASFPLKLRHADTYIGERVVLVGDAAHTVHPLAGQGLNAGQGDVESLARAIEYSVLHGQDLGTRMSLESYNSERYAANHVMLGVCDKLHKLYSVESGPLVPLRSFGLNAVNAMRPLKNFFMDQAAGKGAKLF
ncbi:ubiquinone biosynthesis mono0xygenase COQ6 [Apiospora saccharicola]